MELVPLLTLLLSAGALWGSLETRRFDIASLLLVLKTHSLGGDATEEEWVAATATQSKSVPQLYNENREIILQARTRLGLAQAKLEEMQRDQPSRDEEAALREEIHMLQEILKKSNWHPLQEKQQRMMEFEDQVMGCKVCYDKRVCVVLLPCGHVLCKSCAGKVSTSCCFCNRAIRGTNPLYV